MSEGEAKCGLSGAAGVDLSSDAEVTSQRVSRSARIAQAVARCVAEKTYGATITRQELFAWFLLAYPTSGTPDEVRREVKRVDLEFLAMKAAFDEALLIDHLMDVKSLGHEVWRIVPPSEQAAHAEEVVRNGVMASLGKGGRILGNVAVDLLSEAERRRLDDRKAWFAGVSQLAMRGLRSRGLPPGKAEKK